MDLIWAKRLRAGDILKISRVGLIGEVVVVSDNAFYVRWGIDKKTAILEYRFNEPDSFNALYTSVNITTLKKGDRILYHDGSPTTLVIEVHKDRIVTLCQGVTRNVPNWGSLNYYASVTIEHPE